MWGVYCVLFLFLCSVNNAAPSDIKHIVVLMMENRSFDHLLGYLKQVNPDIDGLTGKETNPYNTKDPKGKVEHVNDHGYNRSPDDPGHGWGATAEEIYGVKLTNGKEKPVPRMDGFVQNAVEQRHSPANPVSMFNKTTAPIINTLALEFAVFDQWHCSLPGPTDPNRAFAMSGTSRGQIDDFNGTLWNQMSYFQFLSDNRFTWKAYYQDDPWAVMYFQDMHLPANKKNVFELTQFFVDVKNNQLPSFTWLQPRMTSLKGPPTWQHPDALVTEGEALIKEIYEALRASTLWDSLAFFLTYDEHGGFYDHVAPPQEGIPSPDGVPAKNGFEFDRLGIRVPMVVASPYVPKGTVVHQPKQGGPYFDATAMIATSNKIFGIPKTLSAREAWVGTFEDIFSLSTPRTDCPTRLPNVPDYDPEDLKLQHSLPLNDHLKNQVEFYCKFNNHGPNCGKDITNQYEASVFITKEAEIFMAK